MAYPTVAAPYGFKPVNLIGGQVFSGSTREYPIAYNSGTAIYYGDLVTLSAGFIIPIASLPVTTSNTTVGVFLGCHYTNPGTKQRLFSQFYPATTAAGDITAIVCDDPDTVFQVACTASAASATIGSTSALSLGLNLAGGTLTGTAGGNNGRGAVVGASATTSGGGFRVLALVPESQVSSTATYVSGTGSASVVVSGLSVGQVIPVGTDIYNVVGDQLQFTGSSVITSPVTVTTTGNTTLATTSSTVTIAGTVVLVQTPEVLVKLNFGAHRYYVA